MGLDAIKNEQKLLPEKVAENIAKIIADGEFSKGDKLPNEFQLATQLNVGRGTIREAMKILVSRNIVEIRRGTGTFVAQKPGVAEDPLGFTFIKDKSQLAHDLCELRLILEPEIAAMAAERATDEDLKKIREACEAVEQNIRDHMSYLEEDIAFHECIAKSSKNLVVPNVIPVIQSAVELFILYTDAKLTGQTIQTHRAVLEAIEERNPDKARQAMMEHLAYNKEFIEQHVQYLL